MDFKSQCEERDKEMRENIRLVKSSKETFKTEFLDISDIEDNNHEMNEEIDNYEIEKLESLEEEDEEEGEDVDEDEDKDSTDDQNTVILLNQLKDRESEPTYNDLKELLESIPVSKKRVKTRQCIHCEAIFDTANKCSEHVLSEHGWTGSYKHNCIVCKKEFLSFTELSIHKRTDHKKCTECPKVFDTYQLMRDHFRRVHIKKPNPGNENFPCKLCGRIFKLKASIGKHIRSFHNNERSHYCDICGKGFFEIGQLKAHRITHTDERPIICDFTDCGKTFKSIEHLRSHKVCHLPPEERKVKEKTEEVYICQYCGKTLQTKVGHDLHLRIHTNERPHECNICHKMFRYPMSLANHKLIHTNEKPYSCDICDLSFRQKPHLKTHQLVHQNEKKFSCQYCNMSTKFKHNLDAHMRNVHLAERNFHCIICEEKYFSKNMLTKHMLAKHKDV